MSQRREIQPALNHLEAALEASCATLMALESSRLGTEDGASAVQCQLRQAIASVREAIAEMRALHEVETSMLAFGFVLASAPPWAGERQWRPRRTA
jgi:hypothetical protein